MPYPYSKWAAPSAACLFTLSAIAVDPVVLHQWTFDEAAGTAIQATSNSGTAATGGLPTWGAFTNAELGVTDWTTDGTGALVVRGNAANASTLVQSVARMPSLNGGTIRFEWDVSWNWTSVPAVTRETYLINRDEAGSNRLRWTLTMPSGTASPQMRLNLDGNGFAAQNNLTFNQHALVLNGPSGNLRLRADFTFGSGQVTALSAAYSYDGAEFTPISLTFTPYTVVNLNDLRLHSKGIHDADNYLSFNSVTVTQLDPPPPPPPPVTLPELGAPAHDWLFDEAPATDISGTANTGSAATAGLPTFAGSDNYNPGAFVTDGSGSLRINGLETNSVVQTLASLGTGITGEAWFRWDISWNYSGAPAFQRRVFMNHRPVGGSSAQENIFRFSLENPNSATVTLGMIVAGFPENTNVLGRSLGMAGSLILYGRVLWNEAQEVTAIEAFYSEDGSEFYQIPTPTFAPYANNPTTGTPVGNLGDVRFNATGDYTGTNTFSLNRFSAWTLGAPPPSAYDAWAASKGLDPLTDGAPSIDFDGDGWTNLQEFILGLEPKVPEAGPVAELNGGVLELPYRVRIDSKAANTVTAQTTTDLLTVPWTTTGVTDELLSTADGFENRKASVPHPGGNRFLRLLIEPVP
jgi:hypothetical protein